MTASHLKSPQVSRSLLNIMTNFDNALVWMVNTSPLISKSYFSDCTKCTNYNWYYRHFHAPYFLMLLQSLGIYLSFRFLSVFSQWSSRTTRFIMQQILFFLLAIIRSGRLAEIRWSIFISNPPRSLCISFSRTDSGFFKSHCSYGQI